MTTCAHCKHHCPKCKKLEKITMTNAELTEIKNNCIAVGLAFGVIFIPVILSFF